MSDSHGGVMVTGQSPTGDLQEALEDAVRQLEHGAQWRLASIGGTRGATAGDHLNVNITTIEQGRAGEPLGGAQAEVPTTRNGLVQVLPDGPSICMDGAEFELVSQSAEGEDRLRLKPTESEARNVLAKAAGTRQDVTVTGYIRHVECTRMDVYHASATHGGGAA